MFDWFQDDPQPFGIIGGQAPSKWDKLAVAGQSLIDAGTGRGGPTFPERLGVLQDNYMQRSLQRLQQMQQMQQLQRGQAAQERVGQAFQSNPLAGTPDRQVDVETASPGFEQGAGEQRETMNVPGVPGTTDPNKVRAAQYREASVAIAAISPEKAKIYAEVAEKLDPRPEYFEAKPMTLPDGRTVMVAQDKQGNTKILNGVAPERKLHGMVEIEGPNGQKLQVPIGSDGKPMGDGMPGYTAPVAVDRGDRTEFVKPGAGVSLEKNLSPAEVQRLAIERAQLGVSQGNLAVAQGNLAENRKGRALQERRLEHDIRAAEDGKVPAGYRRTRDGGLEPIPGGPAAMGKALPNNAVTHLTEQTGVADNTSRLLGSFQEGYAGHTVMGDMSNKVGRIVGDKTGQSQWWQDMALHEATVRNKLFGASLTPNEQAQWQRLSVDPRMAPSQVRENLKRRNEIEQRGLARMAQSYAKAGYNNEQIEALTGRSMSDMEKNAKSGATVQPTQPTQAAGAPAAKGGNVVQQLPMNVKPGTRARDQRTGAILVFDGQQWKPVGGR